MFVRAGPYARGTFRFGVELPPAFPFGAVPSVRFRADVLHPAVDPASGLLDVAAAFPAWRCGRARKGGYLGVRRNTGYCIA